MYSNETEGVYHYENERRRTKNRRFRSPKNRRNEKISGKIRETRGSGLPKNKNNSRGQEAGQKIRAQEDGLQARPGGKENPRSRPAGKTCFRDKGEKARLRDGEKSRPKARPGPGQTGQQNSAALGAPAAAHQFSKIGKGAESQTGPVFFQKKLKFFPRYAEKGNSQVYFGKKNSADSCFRKKTGENKGTDAFVHYHHGG